MQLGKRLKELRTAKGLTLRELAARVDVGFTYLCKIETRKLEPGHSPSDRLLEALASELGGSAEELILLANRIPASLSGRVHDRPEAFIALAKMDDQSIDRFIQAATE
jgi:transcriptional regulator with XRE-family HTH domain